MSHRCSFVTEIIVIKPFLTGVGTALHRGGGSHEKNVRFRDKIYRFGTKYTVVRPVAQTRMAVRLQPLFCAH